MTWQHGAPSCASARWSWNSIAFPRVGSSYLGSGRIASCGAQRVRRCLPCGSDNRVGSGSTDELVATIAKPRKDCVGV